MTSAVSAGPSGRRPWAWLLLVVMSAGVTRASVPDHESNTRTLAGPGNTVVLSTSHGAIVIELFPDKAPLTVRNFMEYAQAGFYDGTVFHRVIPTFMIQGGGFERGMKQKATRAPIKNEADNLLSNVRGTLAMARTVEPNSATCQFFINTKDNAFLDRVNARDKAGYCVFGKVIQGMDVVNRIALVKTGNQGAHADVPVEDVVIKSVRLVK